MRNNPDEQLTAKGRDLMDEDLHGKNLNELPGVGTETANKLVDAGIETPEQLYSEFLNHRNDQQAFNLSMKDKAKMRQSNVKMLFNFFRQRYTKYGDKPIKTRNLRSNQASNESTNSTSSSKRKKTNEANASKTPTPKKSRAPQDDEKPSAMKLFFMSMLERAESFPRHKQMQMEEEIYKLANSIEKEEMAKNAQPTQSTSGDSTFPMPSTSAAEAP